MMASAVSASWRTPRDVSALTNQEIWAHFCAQQADAHDKDMAEIVGQMAKLKEDLINTMRVVGGRQETGLNAKDLKPDRFASREASKQSYRQWLDDLTSWLGIVDINSKKNNVYHI